MLLRRAGGVVLTLALSCASRSSSDPTVTVPTPEVTSRERGAQHSRRLGLESLWPARDGESLVAWTNALETNEKTFCAVRLTAQRVRCWTAPHDASVAGLSDSGGRVLIQSKANLRVLDPFTGAEVFFRETKGSIAGVALSPDGTWLALAEEGGDGSLVELASGNEVNAVVDVAAAGRVRISWLDEGAVVFRPRGEPPRIARPKVTKQPAGVGVEGAVLRAATPLAWRCADVVAFGEGLLVATCDGAVATFDRSGRETSRLLEEAKERASQSVSVEVSGTRALVEFGNDQQSVIAVVEPGATPPLVFQHRSDVANADLSADGRLGWVDVSYGEAGMDIWSYSKDVTSSAPATQLPANMIFHAWSGPRALVTDGDTMLHPAPEPPARHYLAWAPWPDIERRGSFLWAGGGNGFLRVRAGDSAFTLFDVFGTTRDAVVATIPPAPLPPPSSAPDRPSNSEAVEFGPHEAGDTND